MTPNHLYRLSAAIALLFLVAGCGKDPVARGIKALNDDNLPKAEALFTQALQEDPADLSALMNLAILHLKTGHADEAMAGFLQVAAAEKDNSAPLEYIAYLYMESNRWAEASTTLAAAARINPDAPQIRTAQAVVELNTIGAAAARARLLGVIADHPRYAPALFNLAAIERDWMKNRIEGKRYFQRYLAVERDDAHVVIARAALAERSAPHTATPATPPSAQARHTSAEPAKPAPEPPKQAAPAPTAPRDPNEALAASRLGVAHHQAGRIDAAIAEYRRAIQLDPSKASYHYNLGLALYAKRDLPGAETAFDAALQRAPGMAEAHYMAGLNLIDQKRTAEGEAQLKTLLEKQPSHAEGHLALGMLYKKDPAKQSLARKELEQYLKLKPDGPSAAEVRKWIQFHR